MLEIVPLSISQENVRRRTPCKLHILVGILENALVILAVYFERFLEKYLTVQSLTYLR